MDTQTQKTMFSSKSDEWETPQEFFDKLNKKYKFTLDPCCTHKSRKCDKYYTFEDDGLSKSWKDEVVFVNPPYSKVGNWVKKAYDESVNNNAKVVMLIPARTDTRYWHDYIMKFASEISFVKGRLKFYNKVIADYTGKDDLSPAPFPSAVIVFDGSRFRWIDNGPSISTMER